MSLLRAITTLVLAVSILLPATATALGASHCMQTASEVSASTTDLEVNIASKADDVSAQSDCACDQCDDCTACNAPCATGCTATPVTLPPVLQTLSARGKRYDAFGVETLTAYPEDFIRPPGSLQS